jgi:uncharacterized iron-regulated membrane protein
VEALLGAAIEARPGALPTAFSLRADPAAPAAVSFGRGSTLFLDPYRGTVLGEGSGRARSFFGTVTDLHRWLAAAGDARAVGRAATGAANVVFLFIVLTGLVLWWPARWTAAAARAGLLFRAGLRGRARDFSWHNVIGAWASVPLAVVVASAVPISYPWAADLVHRLAGEEPPRRPARRVEGPEAATGPARRDGVLELSGLDALWARAESQVPGWQGITLRLARGPASAFTIDASRGGAIRPDLRAQLTLDRRTGAVLGFEPYASLTRGRRIRAWMRFLHTGEAFGALGQTVAGVASAGAVVLVWTGFALAWRRLLGFAARRAPARGEAGPQLTRAAREGPA